MANLKSNSGPIDLNLPFSGEKGNFISLKILVEGELKKKIIKDRQYDVDVDFTSNGKNQITARIVLKAPKIQNQLLNTDQKLDGASHESIVIEVDFTFETGGKADYPNFLSSGNLCGKLVCGNIDMNVVKTFRRIKGLVFTLFSDSAVRGIIVVYFYKLLCRYGYAHFELF